ncbi:hypothetical protein B5S33_g2147 [[Candida] boidinii]|nr:hypothetical protein B5S30_g2179 [[Candida] boidinii]OWB83516.1 hypothetical protein B5S33_g2147 [[Candida] boidinii]
MSSSIADPLKPSIPSSTSPSTSPSPSIMDTQDATRVSDTPSEKQQNKISQISSNQNGHLFVYVHGLWGTPQHLDVLELIPKEFLNELKSDNLTNDNFYFLKPKSFTYLRTYDGIEYIGNKVMNEVLHFIKELLETEKIKITKISIVGYSLGGLVSRYIIGEFYKIGFFDKIEPFIFTTYATPHLGVNFNYNDSTDLTHSKFIKTALNNLINFAGSSLLGKSGKELFLKDNNKILYKLADSNDYYLKGLKLFKKKILISNTKFDRTVAFFSSYITNYQPFNTSYTNLNLNFIENTQFVKFDNNNKKNFNTNIIDFDKSSIINLKFNFNFNNWKNYFDSIFNLKSILTSIKTKTRNFILTFVLIVFAILLPIILFVTTIGSIISYYRVWTYVYDSEIELLWESILNEYYIDNNTIDDNKVVDSTCTSIKRSSTTISLEEFNEKHNKQEKDQNSNSNHNIIINSNKIKLVYNLEKSLANVDEIIDEIKSKKIENSNLVNNLNKIEFDLITDKIMNNLNSIDWIKLPVYFYTLNSHDSIVSRNGLKLSPSSIGLICFWSSIVCNEIIKNE